MKDVTKGSGAKSGLTFPEMRAKAQAGQFAKGQYVPGSCAGATTPPPARNAGQLTGIVQKTPINTPRTGHSPTERQVTPTK